MKKFLLIFFLLVVSSVNLFAAVDSNVQTIFHQANEAYLARDFKKAVELYTDLQKKGIQSGDLFYNLGNTYYRTGRVGWAVYYYMKALQLEPRDRDLVANFQAVTSKRVDQFELSVSSKIFQTFFFLNDFVTFKELALMTLMIHFVFFGLLALYFFKEKHSLIIPLFIFGVLNLILISSGVAKFYTEQVQDLGVIVESNVPVYSEPTDKSIKLFDLHEGTIGEINDQIKDFLKIHLPDGKVGWMKAGDIQQVK